MERGVIELIVESQLLSSVVAFNYFRRKQFSTNISAIIAPFQAEPMGSVVSSFRTWPISSRLGTRSQTTRFQINRQSPTALLYFGTGCATRVRNEY